MTSGNKLHEIPEHEWKSATTTGNPESNSLQVARYGTGSVALRNRREFGSPDSAMIIPATELATFVDGYTKGDFEGILPTV